jgi:hypothetical protein
MLRSLSPLGRLFVEIPKLHHIVIWSDFCRATRAHCFRRGLRQRFEHLLTVKRFKPVCSSTLLLLDMAGETFAVKFLALTVTDFPKADADG